MKKVLLFFIFVISVVASNFILTVEYAYLFSFFLIILFVNYFYERNKVFFFLFIFFFISFVWTVASLYYIESGVYISEQFRYGKATNSLSRLVYFYLIFIFGVYFAFNTFFKRRKKDIQRKTYRLSQIEMFAHSAFVILLFLYIYVGLKNGFPLLMGLKRFSYWEELKSFQKIIFLTPIVSFFIGIAYSFTRKKIYIYEIVTFLFMLVLFSEKFTGPFLVVIYYIMGYYVNENIKSTNNNVGFGKTFLYVYVPILLFFLIAIVSIGYVLLSNVGSGELFDKILDRALALQGHVWYGVDDCVINNKAKIDYTIFLRKNNEPQSPGGLVYLMYLISKYDFIHAMREAGVRFTNGFPAITLISFGYGIGSFIQFCLGTMVGTFLFYLYEKIFQLKPFRLFIALVFFNNIITNVFVMGEVYFIYKLLSIISIVFFVFDFFVLKDYKIKIGNIWTLST